ncbi:MAG TPA: TolC family protein [Pirellulales bacterium]|nr:TolC family protein [Pirellulales bacterium]
MLQVIQRDRWACLLAMGMLWLASAARAAQPREAPLPPPPRITEEQEAAPTSPESVLTGAVALPDGLRNRQVTPIDLATALDLAGVRNPQILLAREQVRTSDLARQFAAAQILPNLNAGTNFDSHSGNLQQSDGHILNVSRSDNFLGLGANAIAPGTVNVPGVMWNQNIAQGVVTYLVSRQTVRQQRFVSEATRNDVLRRVAVAYVDLLRAAGRRAIVLKVRDDAAEIARLTAEYASTGKGRPADADRAATELARREAELLELEGELMIASSRLAQLLNLDPSVELRPAESWVVPTPIVPDAVTLPQLLGLAYLRRPELSADRVAIETAILSLRGAQVLPFSPTTLIGYSAGTLGGGSNLVSPRFGDYRGRADFDVLAYWTLQSMGIGNKVQIDIARSRIRQSDLRRLQTLNLVREQVAAAYDRAQVRFASIDTAESAVRAGLDAFNEDLLRVRNNEGLPIEVLDSLRLLGRGRLEYLEAIAEYNRAQFELYVALGQPPARALNEPPPGTNGAGKPAPKPPSPAELAAKINKADRVSSAYLPLKHWNAQAGHPQAGARREPPGSSAGTVMAPHDRANSSKVRQMSFTSAQRTGSAQGERLPAFPQPPPDDEIQRLPPPEFDTESTASTRVRAETVDAPPALAKSENEFLIDLPTTLRLIMSANPTVAEARELVRETLALHTKARAMLIPSLNAGLMYHNHQGNFQASDGQIKDNYTSSLYFGGGTRAVAAESPAIPMVRIFSHLGDAIYEPLAVRQQVFTRQYDSRATANTLLLEGVIRYFELLAAEARMEAIKQSQRELAEIVRITTHYAVTGIGRQSDADRAEAEAYLMHTDVQRAEERVGLASARLAALLSLDTATRLKTTQGPIPGLEIVDPNVDLPQLLRTAERRRPELAAGSASINHARTRVRQEQTRPLFPLVMLGYSSASYGGGGVLFPPQLSTFGGRQDFDVMALWTLQNMGVGNVATVAERRAQLNQAVAERTRTLNDIRQEVVAAYALVQGERTQIAITQRQTADSEQGFREELERLMGADALPIEVLNSIKQLAMSRQELVEAVTGYNKAQFRLYVAIGFSPVRAVRQKK